MDYYVVLFTAFLILWLGLSGSVRNFMWNTIRLFGWFLWICFGVIVGIGCPILWILITCWLNPMLSMTICYGFDRFIGKYQLNLFLWYSVYSWGFRSSRSSTNMSLPPISPFQQDYFFIYHHFIDLWKMPIRSPHKICFLFLNNPAIWKQQRVNPRWHYLRVQRHSPNPNTLSFCYQVE